MRTSVVVALGVLSVIACRRDRDDGRGQDRQNDPPVGALGVNDGETVWAARGARPTVWTVPGGDPVVLYAVRTADGRGVLRAKHSHGGRDAHQDLLTFALRPKPQPHLEIQRDVGGRATFRYGPVAQEGAAPDQPPHGMVLLGWDADQRKVRVLKRWRGYPGAEPAWARTGRFDLDGLALASCERVVQKIAACAEDARFRSALFRNNGTADRERGERALGNAAAWRDVSGARKQCQRWASDEETTPLTEARKAEELAREADLPCDLFARELDDERVLIAQP